MVDALDAELINPETSATDVSQRILLLDAVVMAYSSWESVKATTIANCFHKAGFSLSTTDTDDLPDTNTADEAISDASSDDFFTFDDNEPCHEHIADVEQSIAADILAKRPKLEDQSDKDDIEEEYSTPRLLLC